ncbi:MAG TPA: hypothetical protein VEH06_12310 [Candidatus Bathyarchaeia archaeon]|nr:hypothetical protein [Candidatus Bathyarchaeia archaeon]
MCKLSDIIDKTPLTMLIESIDRGKNGEILGLVQKSLSPEIVNSKVISFTAWRFDVTATIYSSASATEVMEGWKYLLEEEIPIDIYTRAFYMPSLHSSLKHDFEQDVPVNVDTAISNVLEPLSLEVLRLSFWINKCSQVISDKGSFENKLREVRDRLRFQNNAEAEAQLRHKYALFGRYLKDITIPYWERKLAANELSAELEEEYRSNISSLIPEFMLATIIEEAGYVVSFIIATSEARSCDLLVKSYKTEVKTFLDSSEEGKKIESNLIKEIVGTLKREKAIDDINDSLSKKVEIILLFLTFSSMAVAFAKYTFEKPINFSLAEVLDKSISLAERNKVNPTINQIPVVTFTTLIDVVNCEYKIFFYMIPYPVRSTNSHIEVDRDKLNSILDLHTKDMR